MFGGLWSGHKMSLETYIILRSGLTLRWF